MQTLSPVAPAAGPSSELPERMHAITQVGYGGPEVLQLAELERPRPAAGEVLIEVHSAGIDRGTWHLMTGLPLLVRPIFGLRRPRMPAAGLDAAGIVVQVGAGCTRLQVGDRVMGIARGSFAEYAVAKESKLSHVPDELPLLEAGALPVSGITAVQATLEKGQAARGQRVLVLGAAGGVGHLAVQLARAAGASVTGVAGPGCDEFLRDLGAESAIDYTTLEHPEAPEQARRLMPGGHRYDLILDCGGLYSVRSLRAALQPRGTLVFVGGEGGNRFTGGIERQLFAALRGRFGSQRLVPLVSAEHHTHLDRLAEFVRAGSVRPRLAQTYPLHRVPEALQQLASGGVRGKLGVQVRPS